VTPEQAVMKLVELMTPMPVLSKKNVFEALYYANVPREIAVRAFGFMQIAWGRLFIGEIGLQFAPEYWCLGTEGNIIEEGQLADNPYYITSLKLAQSHRDSSPFEFMAKTSSVVRTVDAAFKNGSKPHDLAMTPDVIFLHDPTDEGIKNMYQLMSNYIDTHYRKHRL
jgi:hypothetical protein